MTDTELGLLELTAMAYAGLYSEVAPAPSPEKLPPAPPYVMPPRVLLADLEDDGMYLVIVGYSDAFGSEVKGYTGKLLKKRLHQLAYSRYSSSLSKLPPGYGLVEIDEESNRCFAARKIAWGKK